MRFDQLPRHLQVHFSLELAKAEAEQGRNSFFDRWWFFDTNCVSELVKLYRDGQGSQVRNLVRGRDILLACTILQELRKAPDLLKLLERALEGAKPFLLPDVTRFWWTDICNFLNVDRRPINSLEVYPLIPGFLQQLIQSKEFDEVSIRSEEEVSREFFLKLADDIGTNLDERDLCVVVWHRINKCGREWFDIDIPPADVNPRNFPAFYVFFYTYYFRFMKNRVKPELNDFMDIANSLPSPYCERFYGEAKFTRILRNYIQGREPPSAFQLIKRTYKKGLIDRQVYEDAKRKKGTLERRYRLLENVQIFNFSEMRSQIEEHSGVS